MRQPSSPVNTEAPPSSFRRPARRSAPALSALLQQQARSLSSQAEQPAVFVNKFTKVICQGITGKNGTFHTEQASFALRLKLEHLCVAASRHCAHVNASGLNQSQFL